MTKDQLKAKFWRYEIWAASSRGREFLVGLYRRYGADNPRPAFRILAVACDRAQDNDHRRLNILCDAAKSFLIVARSLRAATATRLVQEIDILRVLEGQ